MLNDVYVKKIKTIFKLKKKQGFWTSDNSKNVNFYFFMKIKKLFIKNKILFLNEIELCFTQQNKYWE